MNKLEPTDTEKKVKTISFEDETEPAFLLDNPLFSSHWMQLGLTMDKLLNHDAYDVYELNMELGIRNNRNMYFMVNRTDRGTNRQLIGKINKDKVKECE